MIFATRVSTTLKKHFDKNNIPLYLYHCSVVLINYEVVGQQEMIGSMAFHNPLKLFVLMEYHCEVIIFSTTAMVSNSYFLLLYNLNVCNFSQEITFILNFFTGVFVPRNCNNYQINEKQLTFIIISSVPYTFYFNYGILHLIS